MSFGVEREPSHEYPLVEVVWLDAVDFTEWKDFDYVPNKPCRSWSVGYLVAEDESAITLVGLANEHSWSLGITIPRGMVVEIRPLAAKKTGTKRP